MALFHLVLMWFIHIMMGKKQKKHELTLIKPDVMGIDWPEEPQQPFFSECSIFSFFFSPQLFVWLLYWPWPSTKEHTPHLHCVPTLVLVIKKEWKTETIILSNQWRISSNERPPFSLHGSVQGRCTIPPPNCPANARTVARPLGVQYVQALVWSAAAAVGPVQLAVWLANLGSGFLCR